MPSRIGTSLGRLIRAIPVLALSALFSPTLLAAQARPFIYTFVPAAPGGTRAVVYADLGYGKDLFSALGPERLEQRAGVQLALGSRVTLAVQAGWAANDAAVTSRAAAQAEAFVSLLSPRSRALVAVGVGGLRDYGGIGVGLARIVAGFRGARYELAGNLRLERPFVSDTDGEARDAVDVITGLGFTHRIGDAFRVGFESVAEDLEGFFEAEEAEGGAKLMIGPSLGLAPERSHWQLIVGGGPVFRLTQSSVLGSSAPRDLRTGYVIRTSVGYRW
jgi:hypothetical protein